MAHREGGTGQVRLDGLVFEDNDRSQLLIDHGEAGIIVVNGVLRPSPGQHSIVVQNTVAEVTIEGAEVAAVSHPDFWDDLRRLAGDGAVRQEANA